MRVAIATVQVPFISGGAEALVEGLRTAVAARGHSVDVITLPFRFFPPSQVRRAMQVWETEDFGHLNLYDPDRVICLKFPAYGLRHGSKALWLCHQHRSAYELFDASRAGDEEAALKGEVAAFDARHLPSTRPTCTISRRVSERMLRSCGIESEPIYHPPPQAEMFRAGAAQPYVFFPSRMEHAKRQDLVVRAMAHVRANGFLVFAGEGGQMEAVRRLAAELRVADRVRFLGRVTRDEMVALHSHATAVCFPPLDEDYGYVTLEAMLSGKPVVTCTDSGGPLEFVVDGETGYVVPPDAPSLGAALQRLLEAPALAQRMGRAGRARYAELVNGWAPVVDRLLAM